MLSIAEYLDEYDIAQEVRLERQVHKGAFLLLEGDTDLKRFAEFIDAERCSTVVCFGRRKLINAINLLYDEGFTGALGLADADFDRLTGEIVEHEGIIYSEHHDFDLDWVSSAALEKYLYQLVEEQTLAKTGGAAGVRMSVMAAAKPLSVLRYINHVQGLRYRLSEIRHQFIALQTAVDLDLMIDHVSTGAFSSDHHKSRLRQVVENHCTQDYDLCQLTNGHDFHCILGLALRLELASRAAAQTWGSEVELHIRLAFSVEDFVSLKVSRLILNWQSENPRYTILMRSAADRLVN